MSVFDVAISLSVCFALLVIYKVTSIRMALMLREQLAEAVREIVMDDNASQQLKRASMSAFHLSLLPSAVLREVLPWRIKNAADCMQRAEMSDEEMARFRSLIQHHFMRVNILAGLHWYVLFFLLLAIIAMAMGMFAKGRDAGQTLLARLEDRVLNPGQCWHA